MSPDDLRLLLAGDLHAAARRLLGCTLVRGERRARIVEVESYHGSEPGCHSFRGETPRTRPMFGPPGLAYVYFTYGNHWMLNVVAEEPGNSAAILIRAAQPLAGHDLMWPQRPKAKTDRDLLSGPGKLAAAFSLDGGFNNMDLLDSRSELHIEIGEPVDEVLVGTRIGLAPGKGDDLPWRWIDAARWEWASPPRLKPSNT